MHLGVQPRHGRSRGSSTDQLPGRRVQRAARSHSTTAVRAPAASPPYLTGSRHAPPAERAAPGVRSLVGDAGYHHDAVTACGISYALRDAELLAVALDRALRGDPDATALGCYQQQRDRAIKDIFAITQRLAAYPPVPTFIALQKQLAAAIDAEAEVLAARPVPGERLAATG